MQVHRRGVVVEVAGSEAIVLTPDGQFCRIPHSGDVMVGAEVTWQGRRSTPWRRRRGGQARTWRRWASVAVAACLAIAAGVWQGNGRFHSPTSPLGSPYALVGLDINPSVTLVVDRRLRVQSVQSNDTDGQTVIHQLPQLKGEQMQQAVSQVVQQAVTDHLLPHLDSIVITGSSVLTKDEGQIPGLVGKARQAVERTLQHSGAAKSLDPQVFSVSIPVSVFNAANQAQVPPGQVASFLLAQHNGITVKHLNAQSIRKIFGSNSSALTVADTQTQKQITAWLNELKHAGVFANATPGASGAGHVNQSEHEKGKGKGKASGHDTTNKGNANKGLGRGLGSLGNRVVGIVSGELANAVDNSSQPPPDDGGIGKTGNHTTGNLGHAIGNTLGETENTIGNTLGETENTIGNALGETENTIGNMLGDDAENTVGKLLGGSSNTLFVTPQGSAIGVLKH